ncbi:GNAT family N-acetyltransferase [Rhizobium rhizosphaerae]|uniref:GNAT family N-acetyltransferase n=1 Tax=Xaviernesmea rhizosphaerae TaxID=1672749 RepID=A0A1Q9ANR7_9HYPH|nr:GNAT family N-acetyltransferase [Xaviernesmea rhizosphaerae]OLP56945.1 GNAT family N-acetyltransferase [Xaviernesmea rhizosphaerae]
MTDSLIRAATAEDFPALRAIEHAAFETLRRAGAVSGPAAVSGDADLRRYLEADCLDLAMDAAGQPIGYVGASLLQGWLHVGELDVHPAWQRQGIGRRLMKGILDKGRSSGLPGATLTTDRLAAFNAPFYASLGFRPVDDASLPWLQAILDAEVAKGLDPARRLAMRLDF